MSFGQAFPLAVPSQAQKQSFGPDLSVRLICPECRDPNPNIVEEFGSGDLVCGSCGLVLGDRVVDTRSECKGHNLPCQRPYILTFFLRAGKP
jgi:transcription initiation factor TFIIB